MKDKVDDLFGFLQRMPHERLMRVILSLPMTEKVLIKNRGFREAVGKVRSHQDTNASLNQHGKKEFFRRMLDDAQITNSVQRSAWASFDDSVITGRLNLRKLAAEQAVEKMGAMRFLAVYIENAQEAGQFDSCISDITQALQFTS